MDILVLYISSNFDINYNLLISVIVYLVSIQTSLSLVSSRNLTRVLASLQIRKVKLFLRLEFKILDSITLGISKILLLELLLNNFDLGEFKLALTVI